MYENFNPDCMSSEDLYVFLEHGVNIPTEILAYVALRLLASHARLAGWMENAKLYETHMDTIYGKLPNELKW